MLKQIDTERIPIKLWLPEIEEGAMQQARNIANFPYSFHHVAIMPDCHQGYGMPIGGVLAVDSAIIPNAVGVDIGCGMCAIQTNITEISRQDLQWLVTEINHLIPKGHRHHSKKQDETLMPGTADYRGLTVVSREYESALHQLGTLGSGNHFIEIQKSEKGEIWVMIHSGSRNIGKQVADHYNRLAIAMNDKWKIPVPRSVQLSYFPEDSAQGQMYMKEMEYCVDFAFANRRLMMERVVDLFYRRFKARVDTMPLINIAHNYAAKEVHFGKQVIVHRKGATLAEKDTTGIIPGSQGSKSFIVKGKGNPDSFNSCSHGAGRLMGRKEAQRALDLDTEKSKLDKLGILHAISTTKDLDEATGAYKDINMVIRQQADLIEVLVELNPLAVIKG